jgi:low affinity Fe/Cu permease
VSTRRNAASREIEACLLLRGPAVDEWFRRFSSATAEVVGRSYAFILAVSVIGVWATTGPLFHFSDTWQLVINTGTTIVTFLMVFLIQNTQNRDAHAIHLKLDELIRANKHARNALLALESMSDEDLRTLQHEFEELRDRVAKARKQVAARDTRRPASKGLT